MGYSVKKWAECKALYETGNHSVANLVKKLGISDTAIENRIKKEEWVKGKNKKKIEKKIEENTKEKFARLGMPDDKFLKLIIDGLEADNMKWVKNPNYTADNGEDQYIMEIMSDHLNRAKYVDIKNKMCGDYAPEKQEIKQETDIKVTNEDLKTLSTDELSIMMKMLEKLGGE